APVLPGCNQDGLNEACKRRAENGSPDAKQFRARQQGEKRYRWMHSNSAPDDARGQNVALYHVDNHEVNQDEECNQPALTQGQQYTKHTGEDGADNRYEFQYEGDDSQQYTIGDAEKSHAHAYQQANRRGHNQLTANIATNHALQGVQEKVCAFALHHWRVPTQPANRARSIQQEIDAQDGHDNHIQHKVSNATQEGQGVGDNP